MRSSFFIYIIWWICWIILHALVLYINGISWIIAFTDASISNILLASAGLGIINTYRFYAPGSSNYLYRMAYIGALSIFCLVAFNWIMDHVMILINTGIFVMEDSWLIRLLFNFLMISLVEVYTGMRYYMEEQEENKKRMTDAQILFRDAELARLRQQLQPHFLFNSLNSISALAVSQPQQARKMIQQLSDFLRGTLKKDDQQLVSFREELNHLELYLEIEKVRFGHRLNIVIEVNKDTHEMKLPSLLLQPIIENAIKFGLYETTGEISIRIVANRLDGILNIQIDNPVDPDSTNVKTGTGMGLELINRRLWLLYARKDLLQTRMENNLFITSLQIPQLV